MAINLKLPEINVREQRLGAILSYQGSAQDIYIKFFNLFEFLDIIGVQIDHKENGDIN